MSGRFCVCTKPSASQYFEVTDDMMTAKEESLKNQAEAKLQSEEEETRKESEDASTRTIKLYAKDFERGTLRIKEPGTYILMEDVEFNWNAGTPEEPNANGAWFPNENDPEYPGYGGTRDLYFMGYFAGITIECNDVVIDLNGHELRQSKEFFYQQGFFSTIEVESQPFMPGQV